jgi:hypothetical protein
MNVNEAVQRQLDITAQINELNQEKKFLTNAIITELENSGDKFAVGTVDDKGLKLVETVRWTMNTKAAKEELGDDWVNANSKQTLVQSLRLSREE